jgi:hypothetical protein
MILNFLLEIYLILSQNQRNHKRMTNHTYFYQKNIRTLFWAIAFVLTFHTSCFYSVKNEDKQHQVSDSSTKNTEIETQQPIIQQDGDTGVAMETIDPIEEKKDPSFEEKTLGETDKKITPSKKEQKHTLTEEKVKEQPVVRTAKHYDKIMAFHKGRAVVLKDKKFGYIAQNGVELVAPQYDFAEDFTESYNMARVRIRDKVGFIDLNGKEVIPLKYRYVEKFVNGLAHARMIDGEEFYINTHGEHLADVLDKYYEGIARIKKGEKLGYVNQEGKVVIPIKYDYGTHFQHGMAEVKLGGKHFYINSKGECVKDCE